MALEAPIALMLLAAAWAFGIIVAFGAVFWGLGVDPLRQAFVVSGSSFTTLGFAPPRDVPTDLAAVIEAVLGLGVVALLISYLPSMYGAFQRRELSVSLLATRAGDPPSPVRLLIRNQRINNVLSEDWYADWGEWFADIEESHTSQGALVFFRSPLARRSWVTAAGCVLDSAALSLSVVDMPKDPQAGLCIRSGYLCLRRIADRMLVPYDPDPAPADPISVAREEFDDVCRRLEDAGVPLKADIDQAWRDFSGWRVNYDAVLVQLAGLVMAPYAPWSSDRSLSGSLRRRWTGVKGDGRRCRTGARRASRGLTSGSARPVPHALTPPGSGWTVTGATGARPRCNGWISQPTRERGGAVNRERRAPGAISAWVRRL